MGSDDTLPSKAQIFDYWKDRISDLGIFVDWGEPSCWACGFHYGAKYDIKKPDASLEETYAVWEKVPLQRCHIVPRSLEGDDDPSNLFLMCRECHDSAPNAAVPEVFFKWVRSQSIRLREAAKIREAMRAFGINETQQEKLARVIGSKVFADWLRDKIGLHRPQSNYAPVSSRMTPATIVGMAAEFMATQNPKMDC